MFNYVSRTEYERVVKERDALRDQNDFELRRIVASMHRLENSFDAIKAENLEAINERERQRAEAVSAYETEKLRGDHLQAVCDSLAEQLEKAKNAEIPATSTQLNNAKTRLSEIEAEIKLLENTPAIIRSDYINRRNTIERLKSEKTQLNNKIVGLSDAPITPQIKDN